jgi:hypothetical protein
VNRRVAVCIGLGLLSVSVLAGCGDDDDDASDVGEANTEFCDDLAAYGTSVSALAALDPATATLEDYESAADEVRSTHESMVDSAGELREAEWENLEAQADALRDQLRDAPDDVAVQAILDEARTQADTVQVSTAALNTAVCTVGEATTTTAA